jgi:hypothetical protein
MTPEEFARRLRGDPFAEPREKLMHKITLVVLRHSQRRTPVRTGTLRRSETTRIEGGGMRGFVGTNIEYAPFVHARKPFFTQGITDSRAEIEQALKDSGESFWSAIV